MPGMQLRYPTALDLPPSEVVGIDVTSWTSDVGTVSGEAVSIDRRLFRRLRRPASAGAMKKVAQREPVQHEAAFTFGSANMGAKDEDWLQSTSYGEEEYDDVPAFPGRGQRLAGNGFEDVDVDPRGYDSFDLDDDEGYEGELEPYHPALAWEEDLKMQQRQSSPGRGPRRSTSSPELRLRQQRRPVRSQQQQSRHFQEHTHHYHHHHHLHHQHYGADYVPFGTPPRDVAASGESGVWLTPDTRRRLAPKADPVRRGQEMRGLWNRDRFLRSSGARKFDLRGCGTPMGQVSPYRSAQQFIPSYVPPHEKRRDNLRFQVHLQMREQEF